MEGLDEAVQLFIGWRQGFFPTEDGSRILDRLGPAQGGPLLEEVRRMVAEFGRIRPDWDRQTLATASSSAVEQLKASYPSLSRETLAALEWLYSGWWR